MRYLPLWSLSYIEHRKIDVTNISFALYAETLHAAFVILNVCCLNILQVYYELCTTGRTAPCRIWYLKMIRLKLSQDALRVSHCIQIAPYVRYNTLREAQIFSVEQESTCFQRRSSYRFIPSYAYIPERGGCNIRNYPRCIQSTGRCSLFSSRFVTTLLLISLARIYNWS